MDFIIWDTESKSDENFTCKNSYHLGTRQNMRK